ncbi:MAG: IS1595 family transposase [Candidatus Binataceae bacterium]
MTSLKQIHEQFDTQDKCMAFLVQMRWPDGVRCPRCGNDKVFKVKHRAWNWTCKSGNEAVDPSEQRTICNKKNGYRFSPLIGTVFENTNYPLPIWFEVIYLMTQSKKGMSALQIQRMLIENGRPTAYKTAFYICHRVRAMLDNPELPPLLGVVEVDEAYLGGKDRNGHLKKTSAQMRAAAGELPLATVSATARLASSAR